MLSMAALGVVALSMGPPDGFDADLAFLREHTEVVVLRDDSGARVAVVPAWQGRVATSTVGGAAAPSYGWINRELVASRKLQPHMNAFGGEDRLWLGPEGGQYSIFFRKGDRFDLEHWQTPPLIDSETWPVAEQGPRQVVLRREGRLVNYAGTTFELRVDRTIRLLERDGAARLLGVSLPAELKLVAFESENVLVNTGTAAWTKPGGLLSIWILGMLQPSPRTTVVVPYREGPESELGPVVNDAYFGKVPADRLAARGGRLFFKGDGEHRSKIGLSPERATGLLGSYDAASGLLTIVSYTRPTGASDYVNSMWEIQKQPYRGDAINSYNDGPPAPGAKPLGPFYELESSSPAAELAPGASLTHVHRTFHFQGGPAELDALARAILGVSLDAIESSLPGAPESPVAQMTAADVARGKSLFEAQCSRCHGISARGGTGPSLARASLRHAPDDRALFDAIKSGIRGTDMPGAWQLSEREAWQVAAFVRSVGRTAAVPVPGDPERGRATYAANGCPNCHVLQGQGGGSGPDLTEVGARRGPDYLRESLVDPGAALPPMGDGSGYLAYLPVRLVTRDGRELVGTRVNEDSFTLQLRDAEQRLHSVDKQDMAALVKERSSSPMPEYRSALAPRDLDDLVAFLASLRDER